jgi:hypothetical protein
LTNGRTAIEGWPPDVLQRLIALLLEADVKFMSKLVAHRLADADAAGRGDGLEPGCNIDAVAQHIAVLDDDVAEIDADAELDLPFGLDIAIAARHPALDLDGAFGGIGRRHEFDQHAVAGRLDDPAVVLGDDGIDELEPVSLEPRQRPRFIDLHETAVPDHVCGQDRHKPALHCGLRHRGTSNERTKYPPGAS